jgi:hypothetical protein
MKLISHRGNLNGKNPDKENSLDYILIALHSGYDVEIDIWWIENDYYLGHDEPKFKIDLIYLYPLFDKIWFHCKNLDALYNLSKYYPNSNYFWHQNDDFTLTSKNFIWTYPNKDLTPNSICVLPEQSNYIDIKCYGICSDFIEKYKNNE